ncbi:glycoprotein Xg-like isoform X3 [Ailuropoda melanoleuca]|uniref:glycoprotein Xg-like isoform X3 n=1 Tax=Ailuropoda melanoleuca TaxID=9646 RepID=UPI001494C85B|nr:glycoprotein Xg-like isoform X3 [Ailuropoda melanoleuca]
MESRWGLLCVTVLGFLMHVQGQRDFDLADALDDPEPTKKPSSDIYPKPKPPYRPQPGMSDDSGSKNSQPLGSFPTWFHETHFVFVGGQGAVIGLLLK